MLSSRLILLACVVAVVGGCKKPPPTTRTQVVGLWINSERHGEERAVSTIEDQRTTIRTHTELSGPAVVRIDGELLIERGRPTALRVRGKVPEALPALVEVTTTGDRTDTFPIAAPLPIHMLGALARQSMSASRRQFQALPDGSVTIASCPGVEGPFTDATCHAISGLASGLAFVWIDGRGQMAAAVARTPWGVLVATPSERDASHAALLKRFDVYSRP